MSFASWLASRRKKRAGKLIDDHREALRLIGQLVIAAELEYDTPGAGADKLAYVVDSANALIDVPLIWRANKTREEAAERILLANIAETLLEAYAQGRAFAAGELENHAPVIAAAVEKLADLAIDESLLSAGPL